MVRNIQFNSGRERVWGTSLPLILTTIKPFTETPDLVTFQVFDGESLYYVDRSLVDDFLKSM